MDDMNNIELSEGDIVIISTSDSHNNTRNIYETPAQRIQRIRETADEQHDAVFNRD